MVELSKLTRNLELIGALITIELVQKLNKILKAKPK